MRNIMDEGIKDVKKYETAPVLTQEQLREAFDQALKKIDMGLDVFTDKFPAPASINNIYPAIENTEWTSSFWTGMLWLAYEITGEEKYKKVAEINLESFKKRIDEKIAVGTHDLGFLYSLSCVAAYKLTGNEEAKATAIKAADYLIIRYKEKGEFIQAWGDINDPKNYRLIIDCLMNLPLLYWASEVTGDKKYYDIAYKHMKTAIANVIREDASTFHTFYFDPETGAPVKGVTHQGYSDDSCWARGQAWGIYGLPLSYIYTKDESLKGIYQKITNYFLNRLPEDYVPYWDLIFTSGDEERDSSSASIAVCGMLEMNKWLDDNDPMKSIYNNAVQLMLKSLIDNYTTKDVPESNGLLLHAVYGKPNGSGVDECNIWGDYYYMEALVRLLKPEWKLYW